MIAVDQVAQFMREEPEALALECRLSVEGGLISFARLLGDRTRDGIVKASIQHAKIIG